MLQKPADYDQAQAYDSDFKRLPVGGYVCEIRKMEETITPKTGVQMVSVSFDIAEGEYKDYYAKQYRREKARETTGGRAARWRGVYNIFPYTGEGLTNPVFKGLLVCLEKSNDRFRIVWPLNPEVFKGKKVGLLFREEEYEAGDQSIRTGLKPCAARTVECIRRGEFSIPARKTLAGGKMQPAVQENSSAQEFLPTSVDGDDLPF